MTLTVMVDSYPSARENSEGSTPALRIAASSRGRSLHRSAKAATLEKEPKSSSRRMICGFWPPELHTD